MALDSITWPKVLPIFLKFDKSHKIIKLYSYTIFYFCLKCIKDEHLCLEIGWQYLLKRVRIGITKNIILCSLHPLSTAHIFATVSEWGFFYIPFVSFDMPHFKPSVIWTMFKFEMSVAGRGAVRWLSPRSCTCNHLNVCRTSIGGMYWIWDAQLWRSYSLKIARWVAERAKC